MSTLAQLLAPHAEHNVVLLSGEAGIGKTKLVETFATIAEQTGHRVLVGGCVKVSGEPIPYAPVAEALRNLSRAVAQQDDPDAEQVRRDIHQVIGPQAPVQRDRAELFERILTTLTNGLPRDARLVLVLEDLHWADQGTLDLISFLSRNMPVEMVLLLTVRSEEVAERSPQRELLSVLARSRWFARIELGRFDEAELDELGREVLGRPLSPAEMERLLVRSQGNPFIAEELMHAGEPDEVPRSLQDVLLVRTNGLSRPAAEIVHVVAVIGRVVDFDLLAKVVGWDSALLADALQECTDTGVLIAGSHSGEYSFRHVLTQEALLARLLPHEKRQLHSAVADALGARPEIHHSAGRAAEWATHLYASGRADEALAAAAFAGSMTASVHAYAEAWRQYRRALELQEAQNGAGDPPFELLKGAADAARWGGSLTDAVTLARAAARAAPRLVDRAEMLECLGRYLFEAGEVEQARATYEAAAEALTDSPHGAVIARVAASRARLLMQLGRYEQAVQVAKEAVRFAQQVGARADEGRARTAWGSSLIFLGQVETGLTLIEQGRDLVHRFGDLDDRRRADSNLVVGLAIAGRTGEACDVALAGLETVRRYGIEAAGGGALTSNTVVLLRMAGRWSEAERLSDEALAGRLPEGQALRIDLARAELEVRRGRGADARRHLDEAWTTGGHHQVSAVEADLCLVEADLALLDDDMDRARVWMERAIEAANKTEDVRLAIRCYTQALRMEADAKPPRQPKHGSGVTDSHSARLTELIERVRAIHGTSEVPEIVAYCTTADAESERSQRRSSGAAWRAAAEAWARLGRPRGEAYCNLRQAEAELRARRVSAATAPLRRAYDLARVLGATPLTSAAEELARRRRIHLVPRPDARVTARTSTGAVLTARELDVLRELVRGRTNRQIADTLFLSHRTVGVHVSNLLAKLAVQTRGEAIAEAVRLRLFDPVDGAS